MLSELLTDGGGAADVRLYGGDALGRPRWRRAEDPVQHPRATQDRRSIGAVGCHLEDARHREYSAAMAVLRQFHFLECPAFRSGDAVMFRQPAVEHREIGGYEIGHAQVVLEDFVPEQIRLL